MVYTLSITFGEFLYLPKCVPLGIMESIPEIRRKRLEQLIKEHGSIANLNERLGLDRTNPKLSLIRNASARTGRETPHQMGPKVARGIEAALGKPEFWMDTPLTYAEIHGEQDPRTKVMQLMEAMPTDQWATVVRLVDALAQPKNGTEHT